MEALGVGANLKIQKLCFKLDKLISKITKASCKQKRRMKFAATRLRGKIKNLVDELHKKTARFLVDNFDIILLPTFETSQMACTGKAPNTVKVGQANVDVVTLQI